MSAEKLTHREQVIRISGLLMMLSPAFNFFLTVALTSDIHNKWNLQNLWLMARSGSTFMWLLSGGSVVVGAMMLKGRRSSWVSVLVLLGIFILADSLHFRKDLQSGWFQPTLSLLTNVALFALVYIQEFHQMLARYAPTKAPIAFIPNQKIIVNFQGFGPWAQLTKVTMSEIHLHCLIEAPEEIEFRPLEMIFGTVLVRGHFFSKSAQDYVFKFSIFDKDLNIELQQWLIAAIRRHQKLAHLDQSREQVPA